MKRYPLIDTRPSCHSIAAFLDNHADLVADNIEEVDMLFVGGGDGWMLDSMRKWYQIGKPFLGVNCGTRGFLLNTFDEETLCATCFSSVDLVDAQGVEVDIYHTDGTMESGFFFNDITLGGSVLDYFSFKIGSEEKQIETKGTGLVVCTALGSTGYALNLGQPMIPLQSSMWGVSGIATFPFNYTYVQPQELTIAISGRSEAVIGLDGYNETHTSVEKVVLRPSEKKVELAFLKEQPFAEKRLLLAEEKLGR